jgi:hypothetical protein
MNNPARKYSGVYSLKRLDSYSEAKKAPRSGPLVKLEAEG